MLVLSAACSPNGSHIVSGSHDRTIRIWDAKTGLTLGTPLKGHTAGVLSVAYSSDGQCIISGSADRTIRIWDARTGSVIGKPLTGHSDLIWSVVYSPNDRHIASASEDGTIRVWDSFSHLSIHHCSSCNPIHAQFCTPPDSDGWVKAQTVAYYIGCPQTVVKACILLLFFESPCCLIVHQCLFSLMILHLAPSWTQIFRGVQL
jgi:WD40 repeat protein